MDLEGAAVTESVDVRDDDVEDDQPVPAGMRLEHGKVVPHLTVAERDARGKARAVRCHGRAMPRSRPGPCGPIPSSCSSVRP